MCVMRNIGDIYKMEGLMEIVKFKGLGLFIV